MLRSWKRWALTIALLPILANPAPASQSRSPFTSGRTACLLHDLDPHFVVDPMPTKLADPLPEWNIAGLWEYAKNRSLGFWNQAQSTAGNIAALLPPTQFNSPSKKPLYVNAPCGEWGCEEFMELGLAEISTPELFAEQPEDGSPPETHLPTLAGNPIADESNLIPALGRSQLAGSIFKEEYRPYDLSIRVSQWTKSGSLMRHDWNCAPPWMSEPGMPSNGNRSMAASTESYFPSTPSSDSVLQSIEGAFSTYQAFDSSKLAHSFQIAGEAIGRFYSRSVDSSMATAVLEPSNFLTFRYSHDGMHSLLIPADEALDYVSLDGDSPQLSDRDESSENALASIKKNSMQRFASWQSQGAKLAADQLRGIAEYLVQVAEVLDTFQEQQKAENVADANPHVGTRK